jgi:hypothetical protein
VVLKAGVPSTHCSLDLQSGAVVIDADATGLDRRSDLESGTIVIDADTTGLDGRSDFESGTIVIDADTTSLDRRLDLETRLRNRLHDDPHLPFLREHFPELQRVCQGQTVGRWLISEERI